MEGLCVCGCNHRGDIHARRLPALTLATAKGHPLREWHLDCDRSDPETVSSPVLSKGPEKVHRYRSEGRHGDRQGWGEQQGRGGRGGNGKSISDILKD